MKIIVQTLCKICLWIAVPLALMSCAAVPKDFAYDTSDVETLVVLVAPQSGVLTSFELTPVNWKEKKFEGKAKKIPFNATDVSSTLGNKRDLMYAVGRVAPGHYAMTYFYATWWNGVGTSTKSKCFDDGAQVFSIAHGQINIIPASSTTLSLYGKEDQIMEGFSELRIEYPSIAGKAHYVNASHMVSFDNKSGWITAGCPKKDDAFSVLK